MYNGWMEDTEVTNERMLRRNLEHARAMADLYCNCFLPEQSCQYCQRVQRLQAALAMVEDGQDIEALPY